MVDNQKGSTPSNGKGKRPIKGYNYKKWYANFKRINWKKKTK